MSNGYKPVSCTTHSEYELAILHKRKLRLRWQDASGEIRTEEVMPIDMITHDHAEYLECTNESNETKQLRLDKIALNHRNDG